MNRSQTISLAAGTTSPLIITIIYYAIFVGLGMTSAALGPTISALAAQVQVDLSQISYLFTARSLGFMLGSFFVGRVYDKIDGHPIMLVLLILLAGAMALVPTISWLWLLIGCMLLIGLSQGSIDIGGNTLLIWLHRDKVGPYMNGLHFIWGAGAFLSPIIIAQVVRIQGDIGWAFWLLGLIVLLTAGGLFRLPSPRPTDPTENGTKGTLHRGINPFLIGLIMVIFFLYIGAEVTVSGWIYTYTVNLGLANETNAAYLNSAFFGSLTLTRLISIPIAIRFRASQILFVNLVTCVASSVLIALFPSSLMALWTGVIGLGIGMSSIFPMLLDLAQSYMPLSGRITGWFFLGASAGGMSVPWLIGQFFEHVGPHVVVISLLACNSLALMVFVVLITVQARR